MDSKTSILIIGGTGSLGQALVNELLKNKDQYNRIIIFSRDELKQFEMQQKFSREEYPCLRYFLGDVRDLERLKIACEDVDIVFHTAALKQVNTAEYNPMEFIKTNIIGSQNVIQACLYNNVKKVIALSTDKAVAPINLYGATKLCSDKLFVAANNIKGKRNISFSVVRYGNVLGSRGSVIPFFKNYPKNKPLPVTDLEMTRFTITLSQAVKFILDCVDKQLGGEIFVPKIPSYKILDIVNAIRPGGEYEKVGVRPGEKVYEELITEHDSICTLEAKDKFIIVPLPSHCNVDQFKNFYEAKEVEKGFSYKSNSNTQWLTDLEIKQLIQDELNFCVDR